MEKKNNLCVWQKGDSGRVVQVTAGSPNRQNSMTEELQNVACCQPGGAEHLGCGAQDQTPAPTALLASCPDLGKGTWGVRLCSPPFTEAVHTVVPSVLPNQLPSLYNLPPLFV